MNNRVIKFGIEYNPGTLKFTEKEFEKIYSNPFYNDWQEMELIEYEEGDPNWIYEGGMDKTKLLDFLNKQNKIFTQGFRIRTNNLNAMESSNTDAKIAITLDKKNVLDWLTLNIPSPPFPATQSAAESFRDFAQSFIWDYSLLKSFSVDVPILEKQSDAIVRITKIAAEAIISYTWFKILSPYEYETRYTKAQLLAAPAYRVLELPEDRVLIQSYPNPFEEDALVLAAYFGPLHEYLEKIRLENKSNPEVQAIVQRRIAELNKARFEKFGE